MWPGTKKRTRSVSVRANETRIFALQAVSWHAERRPCLQQLQPQADCSPSQLVRCGLNGTRTSIPHGYREVLTRSAALGSHVPVDRKELGPLIGVSLAMGRGGWWSWSVRLNENPPKKEDTNLFRHRCRRIVVIKAVLLRTSTCRFRFRIELPGRTPFHTHRCTR